MATKPGFEGAQVLDFSEHQGRVDWPKVYASGVRFAYLRATMGAGGVDARLVEYAAGAQAAGLTVGFYALLRPEYTGQLQAVHFLATLRELELDHGLPPAVDVELHVTSKQVLDWLETVGDEAVVYTSASKFNAIDREHWSAISRHRLWIAHYHVKYPTLPLAWRTYWLWQYTDLGKVPGVSTAVDLNQWGSKDQPGAFKLQHPVITPVIAQRFGENTTGNPTFYSRWGLPGHEGIDYDGSRGDPIFAAEDGVVAVIAVPGQGGVAKDHPYGLHVKVDHRGGEYRTEYAHLNRVLSTLKVGDTIEAGEMIGGMGNSGNVVAGASDGTHLHFMLRHKGATARGEEQTMPDGSKVVYKNDLVDPEPYLTR